MSSPRPTLRWLDPAGAVVSVACAVHCLAGPVLLIASPGLVGEELELAFAAAAIFFVFASAARHWPIWVRRPHLLALATLGVALMAARFGLAAEGSALEWLLSVLAAAAFALAHLLSARECC